MNPDNNKPNTLQVLTPSELAEKEKEQKAARNKRQRQYWAKRTPEQKAAYNKRQREYWAKMTPEQKAAHNKRQREYRTKWTPEQKAAHNKRQREYWASLTSEEKNKRKQLNNQCNKIIGKSKLSDLTMNELEALIAAENKILKMNKEKIDNNKTNYLEKTEFERN